MYIKCQYCNKQAEKVTGLTIYPHRPDLENKFFYQCKPCNAYVGCHPDSDNPLGTLANPALRRYRNDARYEFDRLWRSQALTRKQSYRQLREWIDIKPSHCHVAMFNEEQCKLTIELSKEFIKNHLINLAANSTT